MNQKPKIAADEPSAKVVALVLLLALLWGGNSVSIKIGLQGVPPFALATMRFLLGFAAITLWSLYRRVRLRMQPGELLPLIFVSVIFTLQISTLNLGTQITEASRSTLFISTYPFFTASFAHFWVPGDRLSVRKTVGITLAFGGVLLTFGGNLKFDSHDYLRGDLIVLLSGCLLGLRTVVTKLIIQSIHPYRLLFWLMVFSIPCFVVSSLFLERGANFHFSISGVSAIFYQGIVIAGFCFVSWTSILEKYSPSRLVVLFFLTPLFGVFLSYLLLGDEIGFALIIGACLVAYGIYLVNKN
jgi:drug/metabolite transporter (DMT)-like permease